MTMRPKPVIVPETKFLYETDFQAWTREQSQLLQAGNWQQLDIPNLVEEIESLGKQQRQELRNRLGLVLGHLLKWEFQPQRRSKNWFATLREQRREILALVDDSPSFKPYFEAAIERGYQSGLDLVVRETSLTYTDLPADCKYTPAQILDPEFFPEN